MQAETELVQVKAQLKALNSLISDQDERKKSSLKAIGKHNALINKLNDEIEILDAQLASTTSERDNLERLINEATGANIQMMKL